MRYSVYKYIKKLSDSIVEAVNYINDNPHNIALLSDCVLAISSIKEALVKNNKIEIQEIDLFLEKISEIINLMEKREEYKGEILYLCKLAKEINRKCINDIKYKFKIVFFAELGAKWDAMDSVYRAFIEREDCEVLVVLSPIFRAVKLPNGEVKSDIIYRDYLTSMGIKYISFKEYDIKVDLPDITFSSQPYEGVTSEQFWAENIAPYTRLVYIPYFTSTDMLTDESIYVQCQMPMQQLAWKVIGQSEQYKEAYSKYSPNKGSNMIVTGLPKWDWVINMNKRKIDLPEGWEKLKNKKVILRNKHYSITKPDKFIEGIRNVIKEFENTDIAYIYRFHPMMETMFNVYHPQYKEEWETLKKEIEVSNNFVLDKNESYDCAFKFSDILFSEPSSLVSQYLLTKKPVVLMFWQYLEEAKEKDKDENVFIKLTELYSVNDDNEKNSLYEKLLYDKNDYEYEKRMTFISKKFPYSDGKIGSRIVSHVIDELLAEDN